MYIVACTVYARESKKTTHAGIRHPAACWCPPSEHGRASRGMCLTRRKLEGPRPLSRVSHGSLFGPLSTSRVSHGSLSLCVLPLASRPRSVRDCVCSGLDPAAHRILERLELTWVSGDGHGQRSAVQGQGGMVRGVQGQGRRDARSGVRPRSRVGGKGRERRLGWSPAAPIHEPASTPAGLIT